MNYGIGTGHVSSSGFNCTFPVSEKQGDFRLKRVEDLENSGHIVLKNRDKSSNIMDVA
jgi:hypothetical protein